MGRSRSGRGEDFNKQFEGKAMLEELLAASGNTATAEEIAAVMKDAIRDGAPSSEVIPALFDGEPRFADPTLAKRLFQNLLGLWDLIAEGRTPDFTEKAPPPPRVKKEWPNPPGSFAEEGPDTFWVESGWRYLEEANPKELDRLQHSFDNRQDALLGWLDEQGLSDEGYGVARLLLFELFSMIELGWPTGTRSASPELFSLTGTDLTPPALQAYADEALFEAEQDEEAPLPAGEIERVRNAVTVGLRSLWGARKP
jgi:hypothetical protein